MWVGSLLRSLSPRVKRRPGLQMRWPFVPFEGPEDFIRSIFQVAESSYVVHGPEYAVISSLSVSEKYALCVESVAAVCQQPWVKSAVHLLRTATDSLTTPVESESRIFAISALEKLLPEQPAASDSRFLVYCAKWFLLYSDNENDVENDVKMATNRVAMAIEHASDMGLGVDLIQELIKDARPLRDRTSLY